MLNLKEYLQEEKNTHMTHAEDLIFIEGVNGARRAINFLRALRDMLAGHSKTKVTATVKWDGAPAIFCGIDPRDGKFFVAKKGVFNKEPKVYKTPSEIDADTSGDLAAKLKVALVELSKLGIKSGVYQGDLMFTDDLKKEIIDGEDYITFHPNTIVYAIPLNSELGKTIRKAKIGIVWHTTYTGDSFESMKASFGKSIVQHLTHNPSIWMDDANYKDYSGVATFTAEETKEVSAILSKAGSLFNTINPKTLNAISDDEDLLMAVQTFSNTKIRKGEEIDNPTQHVKDLFNWIYDKYQKEIDIKKTEKGKSSQETKRKKILSFFVNHEQNEIAKIFELANYILEAKHLIVNKMNQAGHISTFIKTTSGFRVTGVEGFVAIDHLTGGAVKIINRMEFSKSNFDPNIIKGWSK